MCRLLYVRSDDPVNTMSYLTEFAATAKNSPEYQGHGWGCAWIESGRWRTYHNVDPIWTDECAVIPDSNHFVAHARSAYRNEGIGARNNMPFRQDDQIFIFNGELHGVRLYIEGRIGAEKVFNFVRRYDDGDTLGAIETAVGNLRKKSRYIRAMNFIVADLQSAWLSSEFNEDPEYFQMHERLDGGVHIISSSPFPGQSDWLPIANNTVREIG